MLLFLSSFVIISCAAEEPAIIDEPVQTEERMPETDSIVEEAPEVIADEEISEERPEGTEPEPETAAEEQDFTLFDPTLTYLDAYNGPLYATSEQIGSGYPIDGYMENLDRNGVNFFIGFFAIVGVPEDVNSLVSHQDLGYVVTAVKKYPQRIVPFLNPGLGGEEVEPAVGDRLTASYRGTINGAEKLLGKSFLQGFGEIETQEWRVAHNAPEVRQLFSLARTHTINFMFHPVASKIGQVDQIAKDYPNQKIIIHMFREDLSKILDRLITILNENGNVYFSIDAAHIAHYNGNDILYDHDSKASFISEFDSRYNTMLDDAVSDYKPLVEGAPDKVLWGTEAGPTYSFEPAVYDRLIKISRELIGEMPEEYQEGLGYKNALEAFGEGVSLTVDVEVMDTSDWPECTVDQAGACDNQCNFEENLESELDPEINACLIECTAEFRCIDPLTEDD